LGAIAVSILQGDRSFYPERAIAWSEKPGFCTRYGLRGKGDVKNPVSFVWKGRCLRLASPTLLGTISKGDRYLGHRRKL